MESICIKARDMIFAQIGQLVGNGSSEDESNNKDSVEGRRLVAEYLKVCLNEYVERGCVPPEWGEKDGWGNSTSKGDDNDDTAKKSDDKDISEVAVATKDDTKSDSIKWGEGNIVFKRPTDEDDEKDGE